MPQLVQLAPASFSKSKLGFSPLHLSISQKMKHKVSDPIPKVQSQLRSPSRRRHNLRWSSDSRFPITPSPNSTDTIRKKGVKFSNLDDENHRPTRIESDNAKTSEYAFFKKLKEDAIHNHHSCSKRKEANLDSNPRESSRDRTNIGRNKSDGDRLAMLDKEVIPEGFESSGALPTNTGLKRTRAHATLDDLHRKERYMVEETESTLKAEGKGLDLFDEAETQSRHADVFDRKRQKLLHWVRETSFPDIEDLCSNGSSLVSVLLSRLIPKSNENNSIKNPKLMKMVPNENSMPLPSFESDIHFKKLQLPPAESFMDLGCDPFLGDATLSCLSKGSREMVSCSYSSTSGAYKNHLDYTVWEPDSALLGGSAISCPNIDMNSTLPFEEYGSVTSGCVKELDMFYKPHEYIYGRKPCSPMLGWNFDSMDERKLSNFFRHGADSELLGSTMSCHTIDSGYVLPFREYRLREASHVKELDIFYQPNEYMVQKPQCASMLGWDFDSTIEERNGYSLSRYNAGCELLGSGAVSCSMGDADSEVPFKEYGWRASSLTSHVEEINVFCQPSEYFVEKEPRTLMLGWDFESTNEGKNSSNIYRHSAEHTSACITNYDNHDVERQCLERKYDLQSDCQQIELPLTLSCIPTYLNQASGCTDSRVWEGGTTFSPLQNDHWFKRKFINEEHSYCNAESLLQLSSSSREHYPSTCHALQFPREEGVSSHLLTYNDMNIISLTDSTHKGTLTHFMDDDVDIRNCSALCLQLSLKRHKPWPLGIDTDRASWDGSESEMNFGDCNVNYIQ